MYKTLTIVVICFSGACGLTAGAAKPLQATGAFKVDPSFLARDKKNPAKDLSGAACAPSDVCLAINDENLFAQRFTIERESSEDRKGRIRAGDPVEIIADVPNAATLGVKPAVADCTGGEGESKELDGEGVAYAAPFFYVVGSHGCSRKKNKFILSSFILARVRLNEIGADQDVRVETTYRLADALQHASKVGGYFGKDLDKKIDGLNIEGLAIVGDSLFAGLRAPTVSKDAFLVCAPLDALFAPGHEPLMKTPEVFPLALGDNVGIRDLAALPDGRLLVLAGPTQEQKHIPYSLFMVEPKAGGDVSLIAVLEDVPCHKKDQCERAKAEAVTVLDPNPLRIIVFFDGPENGAPREYLVPQ